MNDDVIGEGGDYRVRLVHDDDATEPYDDGSSPVFAAGMGTRYSGQVMSITNYVAADGLKAAWEKWATDTAMFERYARIFHGATSFAYCDNAQMWDRASLYATCDPAHWREAVGVAEGAADLDDWRAYCEGDVWGYIVERCDGADGWTEVDSCWGFYGREYVTEHALGVLRETVLSVGPGPAKVTTAEYIDAQFAKLGDSGYKLKIASATGETHWISVDAADVEVIRERLMTNDERYGDL